MVGIYFLLCRRLDKMPKSNQGKRSLKCTSPDGSFEEGGFSQVDADASTQEMDAEELCSSCKYVESMLEKLVETQIQTSKELRLMRLEVCILSD